MAQSALRLRRAVTTVSSLHRSLSSTSATLSPSPLFSQTVSSPLAEQQSTLIPVSMIQSRKFRASPTSFFSASSSNKTYHLYKEGDEITPDTILFEGCDYNHWLITMEFPKDPKPTPEEMVRAYEETCAKGLNISLEEAKKRMYACSTTTYQGFQAVMTEEESEKFQGLPGVVFVLPDSYIDPQNKEYGGDKYINGTIIPRPPPIQRSTGGRFRDRNRNFDRPRYNQQGGQQNLYNQQGGPQNYPQNQQGGPQNYPQNQQGGPQNYPQNQQGGPQNYPQNQQGGPQNYPQNQQGGPQNYPPPQNFGPPGQGTPPHNSWGPTQGDSRNYGPPQNYPPQNFVPPGQGERGGSIPMNNRDPYQADRRGPTPSYQGNYNQGQQGNYSSPQGDQRAYGQGNFGGGMNNSPPSGGGNYGQGPNPNYGQNHAGHGEGQRFSQGGQGNVQGEQRNYPPTGQTGT